MNEYPRSTSRTYHACNYTANTHAKPNPKTMRSAAYGIHRSQNANRHE